MKIDEPVFNIEKGIPIKQPRRNGLTATLRKLEVGDSFILPAGILRSSAYAAAKNIGIKVSNRAISPNQMRVWRVA